MRLHGGGGCALRLRPCAPSVGFTATSVGFAAPSVGFAANSPWEERSGICSV